MKKFKNNIGEVSYLVIFIFIVVFFPFGLFLLVKKLHHDKTNLSKWRAGLRVITLLTIVLEVWNVIAQIDEYIRLINSDMPLDMYSLNFIITHVLAVIFILSLMTTSAFISFIIAKYSVYTEFINVRHVKNLDLIMEDTKEDLFKVANNIEDLKKLGYILDVEVDLDKKLILYKKNKTNKKTDNCINCGCLIDFSSDKVSKNCNLCGKKIKKNGRK